MADMNDLFQKRKKKGKKIGSLNFNAVMNLVEKDESDELAFSSLDLNKNVIEDDDMPMPQSMPIKNGDNFDAFGKTDDSYIQGRSEFNEVPDPLTLDEIVKDANNVDNKSSQGGFDFESRRVNEESRKPFDWSRRQPIAEDDQENREEPVPESSPPEPEAPALYRPKFLEIKRRQMNGLETLKELNDSMAFPSLGGNLAAGKASDQQERPSAWPGAKLNLKSDASPDLSPGTSKANVEESLNNSNQSREAGGIESTMSENESVGAQNKDISLNDDAEAEKARKRREKKSEKERQKAEWNRRRQEALLAEETTEPAAVDADSAPVVSEPPAVEDPTATVGEPETDAKDRFAGLKKKKKKKKADA